MSQPKMPPELRASLQAMLHSPIERERRHAQAALAGNIKPAGKESMQAVRPPAIMTPVSNPEIPPSTQVAAQSQVGTPTGVGLEIGKSQGQPCGGCGSSQGPQKVPRPEGDK